MIETETYMNSESPEKSTDVDGDIQFNNVTFSYPARKDVSALCNLTMVARAGETTALVGPSGSGRRFIN